MSKSPSLRRIQADIRELALDPSDRYYASPLEHDMFEWHFTIRGADGTDFEGGVYHGRILLPPEYPLKPPHIMFLTPSGRFETNTKICLSFSAYHPELWQPAWGIRLILEALISFLPTPADGAIGALDWSSKERKRLAIASQTYCCKTCCNPTTGKKYCKDLLPPLKPKTAEHGEEGGTDNEQKHKSRFAKEIAALQKLQLQNEGPNKHNAKEEPSENENGNAATTTTTESSSSDHDQQAETPTTDMGVTTATTSTHSGIPIADASNPTTATAESLAKPTTTTTTITSASTTTEASPTTTNATATFAQQENKEAFTTAMATTTTSSSSISKQDKDETNNNNNNPNPTISEDHGNNPVTANSEAPVVETDVIPNLQQQPQQELNNNNRNNDLSYSWMIDPLLNLMMILLAVICYLLIQKYHDLMDELEELREELSN